MLMTEVTLIAWPDGLEGGPRLLGTTSDPEVVAYVRDRLVEEVRAGVALLDPPPPLQLVRKEANDDPD